MIHNNFYTICLAQQLESGRRIVEETIMNYSTIFLIHKNVTSKDQSNLNELYEDIVEQIKDYVATRDSIRKWTYVNSVFFCITTYTTIGEKILFNYAAT